MVGWAKRLAMKALVQALLHRHTVHNCLSNLIVESGCDHAQETFTYPSPYSRFDAIQRHV